MHIVSVLGLMFALVFGLVAVGSVIDVQADIAALTSGGVQTLTALFPTFWFLFLGVIAVAAVIVAARLLG